MGNTFESRLNPSPVEAFMHCLNFFQESVWTGDLLTGSERIAACQKLFRFKPEKDGIKAVKPGENWQQFCQSIGIDLLNLVAV
jgi:hypothetical protein